MEIIFLCGQLILLPLAGYFLWQARKLRKETKALHREMKMQEEDRLRWLARWRHDD